MDACMKINNQVVDQNDLRVHQVCTILVFLTAYFLDQWALVALQVLIFGLTFLDLRFSPYIAFYRHVLQPAGVVHPDLRPDNLEAHRFATVIGLLVSFSAASLLATGHASIGWTLVWMIIVLATIAFIGWCTGCFIYYLLNRLGLKGFFSKAPIGGAFPGARPPKPST